MANTRALPPAGDWLTRKIHDLEKKMKMMEGARRLEAASIGAGGLTVKGGAIRIEDGAGNLLLTLDKNGLTATPAGQLSDDTLAHLVKPAQYGGDTNSTTLTVAGAYIHTGSVTVPAGLSSAQITMIAEAGNSRSATTGAPFYAQCYAECPNTGEWWSGATVATSCVGSGSATLAASLSAVFTGLTGGDKIDLKVWAAVDSTSGWTSGGANAHLDTTVLFLR